MSRWRVMAIHLDLCQFAACLGAVLMAVGVLPFTAVVVGVLIVLATSTCKLTFPVSR